MNICKEGKDSPQGELCYTSDTQEHRCTMCKEQLSAGVLRTIVSESVFPHTVRASMCASCSRLDHGAALPSGVGSPLKHKPIAIICSEPSVGAPSSPSEPYQFPHITTRGHHTTTQPVFLIRNAECALAMGLPRPILSEQSLGELTCGKTQSIFDCVTISSTDQHSSQVLMQPHQCKHTIQGNKFYE